MPLVMHEAVEMRFVDLPEVESEFCEWCQSSGRLAAEEGASVSGAPASVC